MNVAIPFEVGQVSTEAAKWVELTKEGRNPF